MQKVFVSIAVISVALVAAGNATIRTEVDASEVGKQIVIFGHLGRPVGETVTIRGRKKRAAKGDQIDFFVEAVNGKPLQKRTTVDIVGIDDWPLGTEAEIRGKESGMLTFTDIRATGYRDNDPRFELRQTLYLHFEADEVISPRGLELGPRRQ